MMLRPCFLVVDREQFGSISTRKLVIETAKLNVITAYSADEAVAALKKFPNVDGVVVDAGLKDKVSCSELLRLFKQVRAELPIVVIGNSERHPCDGSTAHLETFDPAKLLELLQRLMPSESARLEQRESELEAAEAS